jgi:hypothetical protein
MAPLNKPIVNKAPAQIVFGNKIKIAAISSKIPIPILP